jgi:hypothetical protein
MFLVPECGQPPSVTGGFWEPDSDSNGQSANLNCQDGFSLNKAYRYPVCQIIPGLTSMESVCQVRTA